MTRRLDGNLGMELVSDVSFRLAFHELRADSSPAADMSKPVYRYLAEQAWRDNGDLGILVRPTHCR